MTMTRPTPSRARTIFRKRSAARPSMTRPSADSSARSGSGWSTGRSCARSGAEANSGRCRGLYDRFEANRVMTMNKHLNDAILKVQALPDDKQREAAALLLEFLDQEQSDISLTPEQVAEIERRLSDDEPYASDDEVRAVFDQLTR